MARRNLLNMDLDTLNSLNRSELSKIVTQLGKTANARIKEFHQKDLKSPALAYVERSGGKISVRNKDVNALRAEYVRAKGFLQAKTGTVKGTLIFQAETIQKLQQKTGIELKPELFDEFWKAYEKLKEIDASVTERQFKYAVLDDINKQFDSNNVSVDDVVNTIKKRLNALYEQQKYTELNKLSDAFDYGENI